MAFYQQVFSSSKNVKSKFKRHIIFRFCQLFSKYENNADLWMIQKFSSNIIIIIIIIIMYSGTKLNFYHCAYVYI